MTKILETSLEEAFLVHLQMPEFDLYQTLNSFYEKTANKKTITLVAQQNNINIGYLIGYERYSNNDLYLWLAGILPEYRHQGIYNLLHEKMLNIAVEKNYETLSIKTYNKFSNMLKFIITRDYLLTEIKSHPNIYDNEINALKLIKK